MTARDRPLWTTRLGRRAVCAYIPDFPAGTPVHRFPAWWWNTAKNARTAALADLEQSRIELAAARAELARWRLEHPGYRDDYRPPRVLRMAATSFLEQWRADNLLKPRQPRNAPARDRRSPKRPGHRRAR